jgi:hypothetical protein
MRHKAGSQPPAPRRQDERYARAADHHRHIVIGNIVYPLPEYPHIPDSGGTGNSRDILHLSISYNVAGCCIAERETYRTKIFIQSPVPPVTGIREISENLARVLFEQRYSIPAEAESFTVNTASDGIYVSVFYKQALQLLTLTITQQLLSIAAYGCADGRTVFSIQMSAAQMMAVRGITYTSVIPGACRELQLIVFP